VGRTCRLQGCGGYVLLCKHQVVLMFDPCPPMPALEFCSSTRCSDTKLLLVVEKCKTNECVILSIYLRCMQHDGWILAVIGRRQAYLAPCHFLASSPHLLGFHRSRHRAPVEKVKFSDHDSDVLVCTFFFSSTHAGLKMLRPRMLQDKRRTAHHDPGDTRTGS
jgi:hypothetical protein